MQHKDFEFDIGQPVLIKANRAQGTVRAQWRGRNFEHSFYVEYVDAANTVVTSYFHADDLDAT